MNDVLCLRTLNVLSQGYHLFLQFEDLSDVPTRSDYLGSISIDYLSAD